MPLTPLERQLRDALRDMMTVTEDELGPDTPVIKDAQAALDVAREKDT